MQLAAKYLEIGRGAEAVELVDGYLTTRHASPTLYGVVAAGHVQAGDVERADAVLATGIAAYPYSMGLRRGRLQLRIASDSLGKPDEVLALSDSVAAKSLRLEAAADLAFDSLRLVEGLLYAEHAYVLLARYFDTELADRCRLVYQAMVNASSPSKSWAVAEYPDTSWQAAYLASLRSAAERVGESRALYDDALAAYASLRAAALRIFAERGHLARAPDPLLVDLFVLDRAGHLEATTALMLIGSDPLMAMKYVESFGESGAAAETYVLERWADEVDAYLERVGQ